MQSSHPPVESEGGLQGDDLLLLRHVQDVPQVDGGADHHGSSALQQVAVSNSQH